MNNSSLWCSTRGNLDSEKHIIFLHGWCFHSDVWLPLLPFFEKNYRITIIDLPGHARSIHVPWVDNTNKVIDQLIPYIDKNSILVGWSLGGLIAALFVEKMQHMIKALVLIACNPCFVRRDDWCDAMPKSVFTQFEQGLQGDTEHLVQQFVGLVCKDDAHVRTINKQLKTHLFDYGKPSLSALQSSLTLLRTTDLRNTLRQLTLPINHVLGKKDVLVPITIENYLRTLPSNNHISVIENASHIPFYSHPESVANELINFIDRVYQ